MVGSDFVFIHINKTGGSSIERGLRYHGASRNSELKAFGDKIGYHRVKHFMVQEYKQMLGYEFSDKFSFSFVRNPWDRMLSFYAFEYRKVKEPDLYVGFNSWLRRVFEEGGLVRGRSRVEDPLDPLRIGRMFLPCCGWLDDDVNFVGRFENIEEDYEHVRSVLDLQNVRSLPHVNSSRSRNKDYRVYYNDYSAQLVADWLVRDIEVYGYKYDDV